MPWTIDAIAMTVVTPITTPRIVSPLRSLLARRESKAIPTPSPTFRIPSVGSTRLFGAQGGDGIEPSGAGGREHAEDHAGARTQRQRHPDRPERDSRRQGCEGGHCRREGPPGQDTLEPAECRQD